MIALPLQRAQRLVFFGALLDEPDVIAVELQYFLLLAGELLAGLTQLHLQTLDLVLVPAQLLFALFLDGLPEMFQRLARLPVFLL
jgi:hypothetical protein